MKRAVSLSLAVLLTLAGCAAASGYDPKRYAHADAGTQDPDTVALPRAGKTTIPDPKAPPRADAAAP